MQQPVQFYSSAWQFKVFLQVLTVMMQKKSHDRLQPVFSLEIQNRRGMWKKVPKSSCLGGVQELGKEMILLLMSIFLSQTNEDIPWDDNK